MNRADWNTGILDPGLTDSKWTPLIRHINTDSTAKWSLDILWQTLVARTTIKKPMNELYEHPPPAYHLWIQDNHPESTVRNDILFQYAVQTHLETTPAGDFTDPRLKELKEQYDAAEAKQIEEVAAASAEAATAMSGNGSIAAAKLATLKLVRAEAELDKMKKLLSLVKEYMKQTADFTNIWNQIPRPQEPDLMGITIGDLSAIWERATRGETVEQMDERTLAYVHVTDAIKHWLYATPSYQVAACVAGFSGFQVSQLYFEKNYSDIEALYERSKEQTLAEGETPGRRNRKSGRRVDSNENACPSSANSWRR